MATRDYRLSIIVSGKDSGASSMLSGIGGSLRSIGTIAGGILTAGVIQKLTEGIIDFGKEAILSAARVAEMDNVLEVMAKNAGMSSEMIQQQVNGVKSMGIETAIAQRIVADFVRSNLDLSKASELARVAQDAAVISMSNSSDTMNDIVYAITRLDTQMLRNRGIVVNSKAAYENHAKQLNKTVEALTEAEKQAALLNAVLEAGGSVAGAYEASMQSAGKQIRSWPRYINDILVAAGSPFQDAFNKSAGAVSNLLKSFKPALEEGGALYPVLLNLAAGADIMAEHFADFLESPFLKNGLLGLTRGFEHWAQQVNWEKVSADIIAGIDNIDWAAAGKKFEEGFGNIMNGLGEIMREVDWGGITSAAGTAFADFWSAAAGAENWEEVKGVWSENGLQLKEIMDNMGIDLTASAASFGSSVAQEMITAGALMTLISMVASNNVVLEWATTLGAGAAAVAESIGTWIPEVDGKLNEIKEVFKQQFGQMFTVATGIITELGPRVLSLFFEFFSMLLSMVTPINISINLPNFSALAAQAAAGMEAINAALSGGGGGTSGGKPGKPPRTDTVGGGAGSGGNVGFSEGGVSTGPRSGYPVTLHGTEAIVPLSGGRSIPVNIKGSGNGGMVLYLTLNWNSAVSLASMREAKEVLVPMIEDGVRDAFRKRSL